MSFHEFALRINFVSLFCEIVWWICFVNLFSCLCAFVNVFQEFVGCLSLFCQLVLGVWLLDVNCDLSL